MKLKLLALSLLLLCNSTYASDTENENNSQRGCKRSWAEAMRGWSDDDEDVSYPQREQEIWELNEPGSTKSPCKILILNNDNSDDEGNDNNGGDRRRVRRKLNFND